MGAPPIVTLLSDYGTADSYVAEMKAALLSVAPSLRLVDLTHVVPPGDVLAGQYLLRRTWPRFPTGTVHLAVVDPGVGTARRPLALEHQAHRFVGPDNGLLYPMLESAYVVELPVPADASPTFHGRDVFAPVAARLAMGAPLTEVGRRFTGWHRLGPPEARRDGAALAGAVLHVDHFGTLVTNLPADLLRPGLEFYVGATRVGARRRTFADVEPGALVVVVGSGGTVEVAVRDGSAAERLACGVGAPVRAVPARRRDG